jgi:hypothetical protein
LLEGKLRERRGECQPGCSRFGLAISWPESDAYFKVKDRPIASPEDLRSSVVTK